MAKLKLSEILDDKPVRIAVDLPAETHRMLVAYAEAIARERGHAVEPARLVAPMLSRFMATDRAFVRARRSPLAAGRRVGAASASWRDAAPVAGHNPDGAGSGAAIASARRSGREGMAGGRGKCILRRTPSG